MKTKNHAAYFSFFGETIDVNIKSFSDFIAMCKGFHCNFTADEMRNYYQDALISGRVVELGRYFF